MIVSRVISLLIGYILGLFPSGRLVGRANETDLRKEGSGNTGMTNSIRVLGWRAGVIVFVGDFFKCVAAMVITWLIYRHLSSDIIRLLMFYSGFGAILGHDFPVYAKFKGGKGIATSCAAISIFDWRMVPICAALFFCTVIPTGYMSIGSLGILVGFFVQGIVFGQLGFLHVGAQFLLEFYIASGVMTAVGIWKHRENIKRLANGTENKFNSRHKKDEDGSSEDKKEQKEEGLLNE